MGSMGATRPGTTSAMGTLRLGAHGLCGASRMITLGSRCLEGSPCSTLITTRVVGCGVVCLGVGGGWRRHASSLKAVY